MAKHIEFKYGGQQYFFTLATHKRSPFLQEHVQIALEGWSEVAKKHGTELLAWAVLPDHIHALVDINFNTISALTHAYKIASGNLFAKRQVAGRGQMWDTYAWTQAITSKVDLERHIDFIHYNPVKHKLVAKPWDYQHSSFREFVKHGYYFHDWTLDEDKRKTLSDLDETDPGK